MVGSGRSREDVGGCGSYWRSWEVIGGRGKMWEVERGCGRLREIVEGN